MIIISKVLQRISASIPSLLGQQEKLLTPAPLSLNRLFAMASTCPELDSVPKVDMDPEGIFKYILIKVYKEHPDGKCDSKVILRGYKRCDYHSDIYDEVQEKLKPLDCEPLGGGRINHEPKDKKVQIYGYSQGYGKADHEIAAILIKQTYPDYVIHISNEGY